jgi:hypothetical protein
MSHNHDEIEAKMKEYINEAQDIGVCSLCGAEPKFNGVFLPDEDFQRRIGVPLNKTRVIAYALCKPCHEKPATERKELLENMVLEEMRK